MQERKKILVTGGAGFIGSALIRHVISDTQHDIKNIDALTYAANLSALDSIAHNDRYSFEKTNICDTVAIRQIFNSYQPDIIIHLAAESHVDRSIADSMNFIQTNIVGTYNLLEESRHYWSNLPLHKKQTFRFLHVSTDEVFGDLPHPDDENITPAYAHLFTEESLYAPNSPYSASKASADHLVRAWHKTYGLPTIITNCSNNYGPYQHEEKLIPKSITRAFKGESIVIYGKGNQIRDWLYVDDHVKALLLVALKGINGEQYVIGGFNEHKNIDVVMTICDLLQKHAPKSQLYKNLIEYVPDRLGHDRRYAIDASKIKKELGWTPLETFETGLEKTVLWYCEHC